MFMGIDLGKSVFALHGGDGHGKAALLAPKVLREMQLSAMVAALPPCTIDMEQLSLQAGVGATTLE
jgi:hypothetical protein